MGLARNVESHHFLKFRKILKPSLKASLQDVLLGVAKKRHARSTPNEG
jgi:hypothetical protein